MSLQEADVTFKFFVFTLNATFESDVTGDNNDVASSLQGQTFRLLCLIFQKN